MENAGARAPANYREVDFRVRGQDIQISGMANPSYGGHSTAQSLEYLKEHQINVILALDPSGAAEKEAESRNITYHSLYVEDFTAPSIETLDKSYDLMQEAVSEGKRVAVHCGEGFGRTGTVLSAFKLKELIDELPIEAIAQEKTETIQMGHYDGHATVQCTPLVKQCIDAVRAVSGSGNSVEKRNQVNRLIEYQNHLLYLKLSQAVKSADTLPELSRLIRLAPIDKRGELSSSVEEKLLSTVSNFDDLITVLDLLPEERKAATVDLFRIKIKDWVNTKEAFLQLVTQLPQSGNYSILPLLSEKIDEWVTSKDTFLEVLKHLSAEDSVLLVNHHRQNLSDWIQGKENFISLLEALSPAEKNLTLQPPLLTQYQDQISNWINDKETFTRVLKLLPANEQGDLVRMFGSNLPQWVSPSNFAIVWSALPEEIRPSFIEKMTRGLPDVIQSIDDFKYFWGIMPNDIRPGLIEAMTSRWVNIIHSRDDFKEVWNTIPFDRQPEIYASMKESLLELVLQACVADDPASNYELAKNIIYSTMVMAFELFYNFIEQILPIPPERYTSSYEGSIDQDKLKNYLQDITEKLPPTEATDFYQSLQAKLPVEFNLEDIVEPPHIEEAESLADETSSEETESLICETSNDDFFDDEDTIEKSIDFKNAYKSIIKDDKSESEKKKSDTDEEDDDFEVTL